MKPKLTLVGGTRPRPAGERAIPPPAPQRPATPNGVLGMLVFLGSEVMFFAGLISAFVVLRSSISEWPPPGQPRFPIGITALNTLVLLASGWTMWRAVVAARRGDESRVERWLGITAALGIGFLAIQGIEWTRLFRHGLAISPGIYGGLFSTIIGMHGVHVLGGVVTVGLTWAAVWQGRLGDRLEPVVTVVGLFWLFVVGIWPILYGLVYLW